MERHDAVGWSGTVLSSQYPLLQTNLLLYHLQNIPIPWHYHLHALLWVLRMVLIADIQPFRLAFLKCLFTVVRDMGFDLVVLISSLICGAVFCRSISLVTMTCLTSAFVVTQLLPDLLLSSSNFFYSSGCSEPLCWTPLGVLQFVYSVNKSALLLLYSAVSFCGIWSEI